jgi:hypothetical protein
MGQDWGDITADMQADRHAGRLDLTHSTRLYLQQLLDIGGRADLGSPRVADEDHPCAGRDLSACECHGVRLDPLHHRAQQPGVVVEARHGVLDAHQGVGPFVASPAPARR